MIIHDQPVKQSFAFAVQRTGWGTALLAALYLVSARHYLLFHTLVELFCVVVAGSMFAVAWNARSLLKNNYLMFLAVAYLFIGFLDMFHTLSYKGMGVFPGAGANAPTQLWIAARWMESLSLLAAPFFLGKALNRAWQVSVYAAATALVLWAVFFARIFPDCFIEGVGLTTFKITSEYLICAVLVVAAGLLFSRRKSFDSRVLRIMVSAIGLTIGAELFFTFYVSVYGLSNLAGHYFKLLSFYLVYVALIETTITQPFRLLVADLEKKDRLIRKEQEQARAYLDLAGVMFMVLEADQTVSFINQKGCRILECAKNEVIGKNWFENFLPREFISPAVAAFQGLIREPGAGMRLDMPVLTKSGRERTIAWNAAVMDDGQGIKTIVSGEDVAAIREAQKSLRESEEKYRGLVENINEVIYTLDVAGRLTYISPVVCRLAGFDEADVLGRHFAEFVHPEDLPMLEQSFLRTLQGDLKPSEWRLRKKDKTFIDVISSSRPIFKNGAVVGLTGVLTDITDRKRMEEEVKESREHLRLINKIVRHDVVNDLGVVRSALKLYGNSKEEKFLNEASSHVEKSLELIARMKTLESLVSSRRGLKLFDAGETMRKVADNYAQIDVRIQGKAQVLADEAFASVVDNIIGNALCHGKADRVEISMENAGEFCEIRIADNGVGIPDGIKEKIFDEGFSQGQPGHSGLGLHIVKKAMNRYGGAVRVEDNPAGGAVFVLRLRRAG